MTSHDVASLGLALAVRGLGLLFVLVALLAARAFWQWRLFARPAEAWLPARAELTVPGQGGALVARFHDHAGRTRHIPVATLLPGADLGRVGPGDSLALTYCRRASDLAYATAHRDVLAQRLLWRLCALVPLPLLLAAILSRLEPILPG